MVTLETKMAHDTINTITDIQDAGEFCWAIEWRWDGSFAVIESWDRQQTWICNCVLDTKAECLEFIDGWMQDNATLH
jgi:hypothetical protein